MEVVVVLHVLVPDKVYVVDVALVVALTVVGGVGVNVVAVAAEDFPVVGEDVAVECVAVAG